MTAIMAYGLLCGAFYCINLLSEDFEMVSPTIFTSDLYIFEFEIEGKGEARRRHKVYLVLCCMLLPKVS